MSGVGRAWLAPLALAAFAANSLLCRAALAPDAAGQRALDPGTFGALRLASGAITLAALALARRPRPAIEATPGGGSSGVSAVPTRPRIGGSWPAALYLALYVLGFSFAYVSLRTGTGALLLFGMVQATMLVAGWRAGERPTPAQWTGLALALAGLAWLVLPGLAAPPALGSALMLSAGLAWGLYSLRGRGSRDPLGDTAGNFLRALAPVAAVTFPGLAHAHASLGGAVLAVASGALTSGLGYVVWYATLPALSATQAAVLQLAVPGLAALGGVVLLGERWTVRLLLAMVLVLGGVGLTIVARRRAAARGHR